ncbi:hypothetical protein L596_025867 [Steinernema carpocapsae]|uniref:Uncharacterized protein n=1 Tax=Steinernema carpocapsae TaxID=34508 RepID=A0A4U5MAE8_STECR|nr:hypothetical protein L596_025867 [Steinernema carpocapsae]
MKVPKVNEELHLLPCLASFSLYRIPEAVGGSLFPSTMKSEAWHSSYRRGLQFLDYGYRVFARAASTQDNAPERGRKAGIGVYAHDEREP